MYSSWEKLRITRGIKERIVRLLPRTQRRVGSLSARTWVGPN
jgi:hypothetical protein